MIEEAVILIIGREECRFAPDVRIIRQRIEDLRYIPCAIICRPIRMLRISLRRYHPANLWQIAARNILSEDIEQSSADIDVGSRLCAIGKRSAGCCILILVEVKKRIVALVADICVTGITPRFRRGEP